MIIENVQWKKPTQQLPSEYKFPVMYRCLLWNVLWRAEVSAARMRDRLFRFSYTYSQRVVCHPDIWEKYRRLEHLFAKYMKVQRWLVHFSSYNSRDNILLYSQVITDNATKETLMCVAYVFEVSAKERGGTQYHIYRLTSDWLLMCGNATTH